MAVCVSRKPVARPSDYSPLASEEPASRSLTAEKVDVVAASKMPEPSAPLLSDIEDHSDAHEPPVVALYAPLPLDATIVAPATPSSGFVPAIVSSGVQAPPSGPAASQSDSPPPPPIPFKPPRLDIGPSTTPPVTPPITPKEKYFEARLITVRANQLPMATGMAPLRQPPPPPPGTV